MAEFLLGARLHDYGCASADEMFSRVAKDGYQTVQLAYPKAISGVHSWSDVTDDVVKETIQAQKKYNIQIGVFGCYVQLGMNDEAVRRKNVEDYLRMLPVAKALNAVCIGNETTEIFNQPAGTTRERGMYLFEKSMEQILPEAERLGVTIGMEPVYYHSVSSPKRAYEVLQAMQSPNLKIIFDPGNLVSWENHEHQEEIWDEVGTLLGDKIVAVHFKGMNFNEDGSEFFATRLEDSCIDYEGCFKMLRQLPQTMHVMREEAVPEIASSDIAFMKKYF